MKFNDDSLVCYSENCVEEPKVCECGCKKLEQIEVEYDMGFVSEYKLKCSECGKMISEYSYGHVRLL